jgi:hypothetical protein
MDRLLNTLPSGQVHGMCAWKDTSCHYQRTSCVGFSTILKRDAKQMTSVLPMMRLSALLQLTLAKGCALFQLHVM